MYLDKYTRAGGAKIAGVKGVGHGTGLIACSCTVGDLAACQQPQCTLHSPRAMNILRMTSLPQLNLVTKYRICKHTAVEGAGQMDSLLCRWQEFPSLVCRNADKSGQLACLMLHCNYGLLATILGCLQELSCIKVYAPRCFSRGNFVVF